MLVEATSVDYKGNVSMVMTQLVEHLRDHNELCEESERKTFVHRNDAENDFFSSFMDACVVVGLPGVMEEHFFHVYRQEGVFYCCLGDEPDVRDQKV